MMRSCLDLIYSTQHLSCPVEELVVVMVMAIMTIVASGHMLVGMSVFMNITFFYLQ